MPFNALSTPTQYADNLIFQNLAKAQALRRKQEADQARAQRQPEVTGRATEYDVTTGDWKLALANGGSLRAQLNSNGQPLGRVPIQRNPDSQVSTITTPPTAASLSDLISSIDALSRSLVELMGLKVGSSDPNNETVTDILDVPPDYPNQLYWEDASGTLWRYDTEAPDPKWSPLFQLYQNFTGDPNDQGGNAIPVRIDGAIAVTNDKIYTGTVADGWSEFGGGGGGPIGATTAIQVYANNIPESPVGMALNIDEVEFWKMDGLNLDPGGIVTELPIAPGTYLINTSLQLPYPSDTTWNGQSLVTVDIRKDGARANFPNLNYGFPIAIAQSNYGYAHSIVPTRGSSVVIVISPGGVNTLIFRVIQRNDQGDSTLDCYGDIYITKLA